MNKTIEVLDHGYVKYVDHMGSDMRIVEAARVSYDGRSKGEEADKKLLHYLYKNKHTSPFEMCKLTIEIKLPIFVMREYVRHRMQNMNEISARYTALPEEFYLPKLWRGQDTKNKQGSVESAALDQIMIKDAVEWHGKESYSLYERLLQTGVARELARMVLPLNIYTKAYSTWDLKNLLHFLTLRDNPRAQWEIQEYARAIKTICTELFPWTMEAYNKYKWNCEELQ